mgnify:CR=1 FL=1
MPAHVAPTHWMNGSFAGSCIGDVFFFFFFFFHVAATAE